MPEENGGGRLDRIERLLESAAEKIEKVATMGYLHDERAATIEDWLDKLTENVHLHDERLARIEINFKQMQEDQARYWSEQRERKTRRQEDDARYQAEQQAREARLDKRVGDLVGAIRDLIERIPPENLKP